MTTGMAVHFRAGALWPFLCSGSTYLCLLSLYSHMGSSFGQLVGGWVAGPVPVHKYYVFTWAAVLSLGICSACFCAMLSLNSIYTITFFSLPTFYFARTLAPFIQCLPSLIIQSRLLS